MAYFNVTSIGDPFDYMKRKSQGCTLKRHSSVVYGVIDISLHIPLGAYYKEAKFFFKFILFIYFWLRWVFAVVRRLPLVAASGVCSSLRCTGFSLQKFSCCGARALGPWASIVVSCRLSSCGARA